MGSVSIRSLLACLGLVWLAAPYWSHQIDDVFITAGFAAHWWETGSVAWGTGERVEGYSSPLWLLFMRGLWSTSLDPGLWAQLLSLASGAALLIALARLAWPGRAGALALAALTLWAPFAYWSAMGMETVFFTLLCATGYWLSLAGGRRTALGPWLLMLAALTRPEGLAWLGLGLAARMLGPAAQKPALRLAPGELACLLALGVYHALRLAYFGEPLPTPLLVKAHLSLGGLTQLMLELLSALPLLLLLLWLCRPTRRELPFVLAPLLLSASLLVVAGGDWMGHGRLLVPGVVGALFAGLTLPLRRPVGRGGLWLSLALLLTLGNLEVPHMERPRLRLPTLSPLAAYGGGLQTPLAENVAWLVANMPPDSQVQAADVGMIAHIPRLQVLDARGLTSRRMLQLHRTGDREALAVLYGGAGRPRAVQVLSVAPAGAGAPSPAAGLDPWLRFGDALLHAHYPRHQDLSLRLGNWRGVLRSHRYDDVLPDVAVQLQRWRALSARFPAQPFLRQQLQRLQGQSAP